MAAAHGFLIASLRLYQYPCAWHLRRAFSGPSEDLCKQLAPEPFKLAGAAMLCYPWRKGRLTARLPHEPCDTFTLTLLYIRRGLRHGDRQPEVNPPVAC